MHVSHLLSVSELAPTESWLSGGFLSALFCFLIAPSSIELCLTLALTAMVASVLGKVRELDVAFVAEVVWNPLLRVCPQHWVLLHLLPLALATHHISIHCPNYACCPV